jgi:hypothetical protein
VIADAQRISHDRQSWIHGAARRKEARVYDVKVVEFVCFAIAVECGTLWISAKAHRAILVCHCRQRQTLAEIEIPRKQTLMTLVTVNVTVGLFHCFLQLRLQAIVTLDIV